MTKLFTVQEVSEPLHISAATCRAWLMRRTIASIRVGRAVRIPVAGVDRILRDGLIPAKEQPKKEGKYG